MTRGRWIGVFSKITANVIAGDFAHKFCGNYSPRAPPLFGHPRFPPQVTGSPTTRRAPRRLNDCPLRPSRRSSLASRRILKRHGASHRRLPLPVRRSVCAAHPKLKAYPKSGLWERVIPAILHAALTVLQSRSRQISGRPCKGVSDCLFGQAFWAAHDVASMTMALRIVSS
jgi:hypothetical protein